MPPRCIKEGIALHLAAVAAAILFCGIASYAAARDQDLLTEDVSIPVSAGNLEAVLIKPNVSGRHPLVIVSHGSPRDAADRAAMTARGMLPQAREFAKRGFIAVSVLRRGYGGSPGGWAEAYGSCETANYERAGRAGAADIRAAIDHLARRDDVDPTRILAVGVSAGGFATVALTADPPSGLVAAISFAGGRGSTGPDTVCDEPALVQAFEAYGTRSRVPMLWVYARNDHFFGPSLAKRFLEAFKGAGGDATFRLVADYGSDGHGLFSSGGRAIWTPILDQFLNSKGFQLTPGGGTEDEKALKPPPRLSTSGRQDFQKFLEAATHKAFAVSATGAYAWRTARRTIEEASEAALRLCEKEGDKPCSLYAIDDAYAP